jgi:hypothetical protein
MEIEGYIIEMLTIYANTQHVWDKFNRKVYKDLETAKKAWFNFPNCYKNVNGFINVKCRFVPVYRGMVECELSAVGNVL